MMKMMNEKIYGLFRASTSESVALTEIQEQKIRYAFLVLLGELEKLLLLSLLFGCLGALPELGVLLLTLLSTKHFLGGFHLKTWEGCFGVTAAVCLIICGSAKLLSAGIPELCILGAVEIVLIILFAPMPSPHHILTGPEQRRRIKRGGVASVALLIGCGIILPETFRTIIAWTFLVSIIETLFGEMKNNAERRTQHL